MDRGMRRCPKDASMERPEANSRSSLENMFTSIPSSDKVMYVFRKSERDSLSSSIDWLMDSCGAISRS